MKTITLLFIALCFSAGTFSQTPCTAEDADQMKGLWGKQKPDALANADVSFPQTQYLMAALIRRENYEDKF